MATRPFSPAPLREAARRSLVRVVDAVRGRKTLVIDTAISGPLSLVAEFAVLREHGADKIYHLTPTPIDTDAKSLVYITRPTPAHMKWIADQFKLSSARSTATGGTQVDITVFFVPRRTLICDRILEELGVFGDITIGEYHLDIVPLEDDLLSLEIDAFRPLFLDGDTSAIHAIAHALLKFQVIYGPIPRILGKGDASKILATLLVRMRREYIARDPVSGHLNAKESDFDSIIILDRSVDLIGPLRTQLTYEGLVDELFSIKTTFVEVPTPAQPTSANIAAHSKPKKLALNNRDQVFSEIRNLGFEVVGEALSQVALRIQQEEDERHKMTTTSQLKDFTAKLGSLQQQRQSLGQHNAIYDEILKYAGKHDTAKLWSMEEALCRASTSGGELEFIDDLISRQTPLVQILRLLCLYCIINGGIKHKTYDSFRRSVVQTYGYHHLLTLQNLRRLSLLFPQEATSQKSTYPQLSRQLHLSTDYDSDQVDDTSYVYHGFSPITVKLVQAACHKSFVSMDANVSTTPPAPSWRGCEDTLKLLPGAAFEETLGKGDRSFRKKTQDQSTTLTLVVFLGGCTMAEVAAFRFLNSLENSRRSFVILTTSVVTGSRLIDSVVASVPGSAGNGSGTKNVAY